MSVLRNLEQRIENLVEGVFSRAFSSQVQPVEIARKLAKEMDAHRNDSVSRVYVPNQYTVWLSAEDRERLEGYERSLEQELSAYLLEHARRHDYALRAGAHDGRQRAAEAVAVTQASGGSPDRDEGDRLARRPSVCARRADRRPRALAGV